MMDATRKCDKERVMLKKISSDEGSHELMIIHLFSSPDIAKDPRNPYVPLLDFIEIPQNGQNLKLMVMPYLRPFNDPPFRTFGEFVAFFTQICKVGFFQHPHHEPIPIDLSIRVSNSCTSGRLHTGTRGRYKCEINF